MIMLLLLCAPRSSHASSLDPPLSLHHAGPRSCAQLSDTIHHTPHCAHRIALSLVLFSPLQNARSLLAFVPRERHLGGFWRAFSGSACVALFLCFCLCCVRSNAWFFLPFFHTHNEFFMSPFLISLFSLFVEFDRLGKHLPQIERENVE